MKDPNRNGEPTPQELAEAIPARPFFEEIIRRLEESAAQDRKNNEKKDNKDK